MMLSDLWEKYTVKSLTRLNHIDYISLSNEKCVGMEIEWLKCADRVGLHHSREKCRDIFDDLQECKYKIKSRLRMKAMKVQALKKSVGLVD